MRSRSRQTRETATHQPDTTASSEPPSNSLASPSEQNPPLFLFHPATGETTGSLRVFPRQSSKLRPVSSAAQLQQTQEVSEDAVRPTRAPESSEAPNRGRTPSRGSLLRHPSDQTESRNTSNASSQRTSDSHWDEILPRKIDCKLELHLNSEELDPPAPVVSVHWLEKDPFVHMVSAADQRLNQAKVQSQKDAKSPDTDLPLPRHNLETGSCRIVGKRHASAARKLDHERQMDDVLIPRICGFIAEHPRERFELEIKWHYSTIFIRKEPGRPYKATISDAIHGKVQTNFNNQKYIPRSDLNRITSAIKSEVLIDEDPTVNDKDGLKKLIKPEAAEHTAERLLAVCIYAKIDLSFLESLLQEGLIHGPRFSDQNCPKRENRPSPINQTDYDRFLEYAPMFFAHKFGEEEKADPEEYANILDDVILPIHFEDNAHGKDFLGSGAFSEVYRATIHPYHHVFSQVLFNLTIFCVWANLYCV